MSRKLPALNAENTAFWQGGKNGELLIYHCAPCNTWFHPPAPVCPHCASFEVGPRPVSGKATVLSYSINHQKWIPGLEVPYVVAIVELADQKGLHFVTNIVDCAPDEVTIDMPVHVTFLQIEDVWLPLFEKDAQ
ncbi:Zn-ribbon domain-containing OB-fold protein [Glaciimonas immobilis]|uniref:DNA-binding protein n=1 Tax=Glaciimonas immobilis TaxID=728004 RepID=A0A840RVQ8_9BURK|nr:OB-fold domain-containing protein [Glaciimonas immobilis]KAF3996162.1 DNA-binding protein [Glaciimonas immobilis]MBB5201683.1 hypothetical protein [Glaciimonas immobilis]